MGGHPTIIEYSAQMRFEPLAVARDIADHYVVLTQREADIIKELRRSTEGPDSRGIVAK
jgi:hypothetical protein